MRDARSSWLWLLAAVLMQARVGFAAELHLQLGHSGPVYSVAYSPDGKYVVSAGGDNVARLWELATMKELRAYSGHSDRVTAVAYSPDGRLFATSSFDKTVKLWEVASGREVRTFTGHTGAVHAVAFSRDGAQLASVSEDASIKLWDAETGKEQASLSGHSKAVNSLAYSPDGQHLASAGQDDLISVWDLRSRERISWVVHGKSFTVLAYSPDGSVLASGSFDKSVRLWNPKTGALLRELGSHESAINMVAFSLDGRLLASASSDDTARIWDVATGKVLQTLPHPKWVHSLAFSGDGLTLATGCDDRGVRIWEVASGRAMPSPSGRAAFITGAAMSPDGKVIAAVTALGRLIFWDVAQAKQLRSVPDREAFVSGLAYSGDGTRIVTGGLLDDKINVWDAALGKRAASITRPRVPTEALPLGPYLWAIAFAPNGREIAIGTDNALQIFDLASGRLLRDRDGSNKYVRAVAYSPTGRSFAAAWDGNLVRVWDGASTDVRFTLAGHTDDVIAMAYHPDGHTIATASTDETVRLWDADTGKALHTLRGLKGEVSSVAFSADGNKVISGGRDHSVRVWETATGAPVQVLSGHEGNVSAVAQSPSGKYLFSAGYDGTLRLWRNGQSLVMASSPSGEWLIYNDEGYFDASPRGGELVAIVDGMHAYNVDQLALKNNRPDLLLARMDLGSRELIAYYNQRYLSRLQKAKIAEAALSSALDGLPTAAISAPQRASGDRDQAVTLSFTDKKKLRSYQLFVNGVALFEGVGKPLSGKSAALNETIALTPGVNRIEASVINSSGQESLRALVVVDEPAKLVGRLFYLGIGVSNYEDPAIPDLSYAHADALALGDAFAKLKGYRGFVIRTFVEADATRQNIMSAAELLKATRPEDTVVVFIAGHGLHDATKTAKYYYLTSDTKLSKLAQTAASFEDIEGLLDGLPARQKLLLMDTCESGEREAPLEIATLAAAKKLRLESRGLRIKETESLQAASGAAARPWLLDRDRYIYQDLSRRTGAMVFSSSKGTEFSYESSALANGLFTHALLAGLSTLVADSNHDGAVSSDELRTYVSAQVASASGELQHPTVDRDNPALRLTFRPGF